MNIEEVKEYGVYLKHHGYNCAQAVVMTLAEYCGYDSQELLKAVSGFAVGMGMMEATCGSLIRVNIIAGLRCGGKGTVAYSAQLLKCFESKSKATICKVLKGVETGEVLCQYDDCVLNAIASFAEVLIEKEGAH